MKEPLVYEGHIAFQDVEPGVSGDVIQLLEAKELGDAKMSWPTTLDVELSRWLGLHWTPPGKKFGPLRITIEEIPDQAP